MSAKDIVAREHAERVWDKLAEGAFTPAELRPIDVDGNPFIALYLPIKETFVPDVYLDTKLSFYAWPRMAAYRHRFILAPRENLGEHPRWYVARRDFEDWMTWSLHMEHVVTLSTYKSGASHPNWLHGQSFPLKHGGVQFSALRRTPTETIVRFGQMPHFERLAIQKLTRYPAFGIRVTGDGTPEGRREMSKKLFEFAVNYDDLKAFNLVIVPVEGKVQAYFFPRRRTGRAIFGPRRWQIASLEMNGLMQAKSLEERDALDAGTIKNIFKETCIDEDQFNEFLELIDAF